VSGEEKRKKEKKINQNFKIGKKDVVKKIIKNRENKF